MSIAGTLLGIQDTCPTAPSAAMAGGERLNQFSFETMDRICEVSEKDKETGKKGKKRSVTSLRDDDHSPCQNSFIAISDYRKR